MRCHFQPQVTVYEWLDMAPNEELKLARVPNPLSMAAMVREGNGRMGTKKLCSPPFQTAGRERRVLAEKHYIPEFRYLKPPLVKTIGLFDKIFHVFHV